MEASIYGIGSQVKVESSLSNIQTFLTTLALLVSVLLCSPAQAANENSVSVAVSRIGDASHLEFSGAADWKYDLKKDEKGNVVLNLAGLKPDALTQLRQLKDSVIKDVKVDENGVDGAIQVSFTTAQGSDFFDYITEQPSRLIVDFFPQEGSDAPAAKTEAPKKDAVKKLPAKKQVAASDDEDDDDVSAGGSVKDISTIITGRKPAGTDFPLMAKQNANEKPSLAEEISGATGFEHGIFDGGDPEFKRFAIRDYEISEDAIFKSRGNYYLPFPMLDLGNPQLKALIEAPPTYEIVANDTRENKEARIILQLYSTGKKALFLTTSAEFLKKYPNSQYDEIIRYMNADLFEKQWREKGQAVDFEAAMGSYQSLTEKYPNSPVTARTLLFMGYSYVERGDSFGALKAFQRFVRMNPTSKHLDQVNIATAEAYLKLNRFEDAVKMLEQIETSGKTAKVRQEASFRKGDAAFRKKDYAGAIKLYREAIQKFPETVQRFPNAFYNTAEAMFTNGQYREALEAYRGFLTKFPDHIHGGYAMTRMGELLGILGAEPKRAQGAFMESFFRYRSTPGAGVARIRMLVSRMPEMKEKELASGLKEIAAITEKYAGRPKKERSPASDDSAGNSAADSAADGTVSHSSAPAAEAAAPAEAAHEQPAEEEELGENLAEKKPVLQGIEEFTTLLLADGYNARREYDRAAKDLIAYYQKNPQSANKDRITSRIKKNIADTIGQSVDQGNFMAALRDYSKNTSGWLKNTDRIDVKYDIGRAYEQAGVFTEAATAYQESLKKREELKKSGQEREHAIYEKIPSVDQINLRLAIVAAKTKDFAGAETKLKAIASAAVFSSTEQIERAEVSADVAEARGQVATARKYLTDLLQTWKGDAGLTSPLHLRIAKIEGAAKRFKEADAHLVQILSMKKDGAAVSDDVVAKALQLRGEQMVARGNRAEAVKAYTELLETFGETRPLASVRYKLGQLLYEDGNLKAAQITWAELKPEKDGLWARLANEQMQGAKWQNDYKKYLNRIPAASSLR